ncbi:Testis-specific serine/threonine-protein kinase 2 [Holothuria leucospilota]|uniref:Testis-specific serine/threonine-protein kinase 2 n=1 Tax=Holothuria leucospilota TaxID=206669 RepID=A0A9Q1BPR9_HOLLE|nr:Testis-specific serine/threonine-protein kinase 2 [Holothuria leucospilota]
MMNEQLISHGYTPTKVLSCTCLGSRVILAQNPSGQAFALKSSAKKVSDEQYQETQRYLENEAKILSSLDHEHVVKLIETFHVNGSIVLVLEYMCGGTLGLFIRNSKKLHTDVAKKLANQLTDAITYLHTMNIAHCDIKSDNVLLDEQRNVKLADFGFAEDVRMASLKAIVWKGSPSFSSPEKLRGEVTNLLTGDVWSLGVVVFHMVTGYLPFGNETLHSILDTIDKPLRWPRPMKVIDSTCRDFVELILRTKESNRPTIQQLGQHSWLLE